MGKGGRKPHIPRACILAQVLGCVLGTQELTGESLSSPMKTTGNREKIFNK